MNSLYCTQSTLCMGEKCKMWKSLKNYYFKNIVYSCIIFCVCIAPVQVHNWAKYEGSKLNHAVRRATWKIELKWLPFKKYRLYSLIHVHILGAYVHICAKYEVSVIKPVDRTVQRWQQQWWQRRHTPDNSWLYRLIGMTAKWANKLVLDFIIRPHLQLKAFFRLISYQIYCCDFRQTDPNRK